MNDDELHRQYAALRRDRAQRPASDRPDIELIRKALDGELPEAECEAVLDRALTSGASADVALLQAARSASFGAFTGAAAGADTRETTARRASKWWPLAAAAVLVVAVGVPVATRQSERDAPTRFRAAEPAAAPRLLSPASGTVISAGQRFVWSAVPGTASYSLELLDARGRTVTQVSSKDTVVVLAASVTDADRARTTGWWVTAIAVDGRRQRSELRLTGKR